VNIRNPSAKNITHTSILATLLLTTLSSARVTSLYMKKFAL